MRISITTTQLLHSCLLFAKKRMMTPSFQRILCSYGIILLLSLHCVVSEDFDRVSNVIQCSDTEPCPDGYYCATYFREEGICLVENTKSNDKMLHTDDETNRLLESDDAGKDEPAPIGPFLPLTEKEFQGLKDENSEEEEENDIEERQDKGEREEKKDEKEDEDELDKKQEEKEREEQEQEEDDKKEKQMEKQEDDEGEEGRVEPIDDLDEPDEEIIENDKEENDQEEEELNEEEDDKEEYEEDQDDDKDLDTTDRITRNVNEDEGPAIDDFEDAETNVVTENDDVQVIEDDMTTKDESEGDEVEEKTKPENEPKDDDNIYTDENEEKIDEEINQNSMANSESEVGELEEKTKPENEPKDDGNIYTDENEEKIDEETNQNFMANSESEVGELEEKIKPENEPKDDDNIYTDENEEKMGEETNENSMANIEDNDMEELKVTTRSVRGLKRVPRRGRYRYRHRFNGRRGHHRHPYRNHGRVNKVAIKKKDLPTVRRILKSFMHLTKYHYKLDVAHYLNQYRRGNIKTIREVEQLTKTRDAILKAEKTGFKGSDKPETIVEVLKKASPRNSDNFIFKFLYNYYNGQRYTKRKYQLFKARITNTKASTKGCCSPPSTKQKTEQRKKANSRKHFFRKHHGNHLKKPLVHNKIRSKPVKQYSQPLVNHEQKIQHLIQTSTPKPEPNMKHETKTTHKTPTSQIMSTTKEKLNTVVKEASAALDALNKAGTRQKRDIAHEFLKLSFGMAPGPSQWDDLNTNQQHNAVINSHTFKREVNWDHSQGVPNPSTNLPNRGHTSHEQVLADFESSSDKKQTVDSLDQPNVKSNSFKRNSHHTFEDKQENMNQEIDDKNDDDDMDPIMSEEEAKHALEDLFVEEYKMRMKRAYRRYGSRNSYRRPTSSYHNRNRGSQKGNYNRGSQNRKDRWHYHRIVLKKYSQLTGLEFNIENFVNNLLRDRQKSREYKFIVRASKAIDNSMKTGYAGRDNPREVVQLIKEKEPERERKNYHKFLQLYYSGNSNAVAHYNFLKSGATTATSPTTTSPPTTTPPQRYRPTYRPKNRRPLISTPPPRRKYYRPHSPPNTPPSPPVPPRRKYYRPHSPPTTPPLPPSHLITSPFPSTSEPMVTEPTQTIQDKSCTSPDGSIVQPGDKIKIKCNTCECRNGRLECTQFKCTDNAPANINDSGDKTDKSSPTQLPTNLDPCSRCEKKKGEEVCGANGKTYNSLCHAVNCAGLKETDITMGPCEKKDPCKLNNCGKDETCVPTTNGPCFALYNTAGKKVPCEQFMCIATKNCPKTNNAEVCGSDGETYPSPCYLHKAKVKLAYTGPCRPDQCKGEVCGSTGVTYKSSCHAKTHSVRIDYYGKCFADDLSREKSCEEVRKAKRCAQLKCKNTVIPEDSCCPVCGAAVSIHPNAKGLADMKESNHMYVVENFIRKLVPESASKNCHLTTTMTDKGDLSIVLEAVGSAHDTQCIAASKELAELINNPPKALETDTITKNLGPAGKKSVQKNVSNNVNTSASNTTSLNGDETLNEDVNSGSLVLAPVITNIIIVLSVVAVLINY